MDLLLTSQLPRLMDLLARQGWVELPNAVSKKECDALAFVLEDRYVNGAFKAAGIGQGQDQHTRKDIRGDKIQWLEKDDPAGSVQIWLKEVDDLRLLLNEAFFLSTQDYDCHFSCYEIGTSYQKHQDKFRGKSTRVLSVILYLNEGWVQGDDGELLVYDLLNTSLLTASIKPELGTIVIFDSDTITHEVRETKRRRLSLTGWLTRVNPP